MLRALLLLLGVLLVGESVSFAQPKTGAALLPGSFLGVSQQRANILLNTLQDRLSREFALVSQTEVEGAFEQAQTALPGEQCTEENCVALVQEYLKVNLIFNLQVVSEEESGISQITLSLVEGKRKTVRAKTCEKCGLGDLIKSLQSVTTELLNERGRDRIVAESQPSIRIEPTRVSIKEGRAGSDIQIGVGSPLRGTVTLQLSSDSSRLRFSPHQVSFDANDWGELKTVNLSVQDDSEMSGVEKVIVTITVVSSPDDIPYSFLGGEELEVEILDDDQVGLLTLQSSPNGAQVFLNGKHLVDNSGAPVLTPITIEVSMGKNRIELRRSGYRNQILDLNADTTRLGTRNLVLRPEGATLRVIVDSENRNGELVINDSIRIPLEGETEKSFETEATEYRVRLEDRGDVSPEQQVVLRGKETKAVRFSKLNVASVSLPTKTDSIVDEWSVGISTNLLLTQGSEFPWSHVRLSNHISGTLETATDWGNVEGLYSLSSTEKIERSFLLNKGEESYLVSEVSWQKWGVRYWNKLNSLPKLRFMLGLTEHIWSFKISEGIVQGSQLYWEFGTGYRMNFGDKWGVEPRLVFYGSNMELNTAVGYRF
jgi:hypothetical protein